jgi:phage terminase small subunit
MIDEQPEIKSPPVKRVTAKEIVFCHKLLEGLSTKEAAIASGFGEATAVRASTWIREDREHSKRPQVFDYFQKLVKQKLRLHDITVDNVLNELKIIAFSSLEHFIDLPTKGELKAEALQAAGLGYTLDPAGVEEWKKFRPGSYIRLKAWEDIPKQLLPAIAEINETKDGIRIKLHPKLDAIEKLAKYLAMYQNASADPDDVGQSVKEINLIVEGSKSPLMLAMKGGGGEEAKSA